jgi:hypothetical protein
VPPLVKLDGAIAVLRDGQAQDIDVDACMADG